MADNQWPYKRYRKVSSLNYEPRRMLNSFLITPSMEFSYSLCIEYMKSWFLKRFNKHFFGDNYEFIYVDGSHVFDEFNLKDRQRLLMKAGPDQGALAIIPTIDDDFNREQLEDSFMGADIMVKRSRYQDSFFKDMKNDRYISTILTLISMNFVFKVRVETLAQQMDLFKRMKLMYRVGYTQGEYISMDYVLPRELMYSIALDAGYKIKNGEIENPIAFLSYLNRHSQLPILYKHRCVNGHNEFFTRMDNMYVWINAESISRDQGERLNSLTSKYTIEMNCKVRFPSAHYYIYHTAQKVLSANTGKDLEPSDSVFKTVYNLRQFYIPPTNPDGWNAYLYSEYEDDPNKILEIEFEDFFEGNEIARLIKHALEIHINPRRFIDIELYNDGEHLDYHIEWATLKLTTKEKAYLGDTYIVIYLDLEYLNNHKVEVDNIQNNHFGPNNTAPVMIEEDRNGSK